MNPSASRRTKNGPTISESSAKQVRSLSKSYESSNFSIVEPQNLEGAEKKENWIKVMKNKRQIIEKNNTQKLSNQPKDHEVMGDNRIYKTKINTDGSVKKYKGKLETKGSKPKYDINYWKIYAPMRRLTAQKKWQSLNKEIYVKEPHGISNQGESIEDPENQSANLKRIKSVLRGSVGINSTTDSL